MDDGDKSTRNMLICTSKHNTGCCTLHAQTTGTSRNLNWTVFLPDRHLDRLGQRGGQMLDVRCQEAWVINGIVVSLCYCYSEPDGHIFLRLSHSFSCECKQSSVPEHVTGEIKRGKVVSNLRLAKGRLRVEKNQKDVGCFLSGGCLVFPFSQHSVDLKINHRRFCCALKGIEKRSRVQPL